MNLSISQDWISQIRLAAANRMQLRIVTSVWVTALLAFGLAHYLQLPEGNWIVISALLGLYASTSLILQRRYLLTIGAMFATGLFAWLAGLLANQWVLLAVFLSVLTFGAVYLGLRSAVLWPATLAASLCTILSASFLTPFALGVERFGCIELGFALALLMQITVMRGRLSTDLRLTLANSVLRLARLSQAIFLCYVTHNYAEQHFNYERKLHKRRGDFFYEINQARLLLTRLAANRQKKYAVVLSYIEQCYEVLQAISLLVHRVEDHATFAVADKEFLAISGNMDTRLRQLAKAIYKKKRPQQSNDLNEMIYEFEEVNRSVLQVVAKEPLVFVIFIQDMRTLDKIFAQLADAISNL